MKGEITALKENETCQLTTFSSGKKLIGCRWVYKIKLNSDGPVESYKARLIAKGFTRKYGIDYFEKFSPVAKMNIVTTVLALASINNWPLFEMDVHNAFLQEILIKRFI